MKKTTTAHRRALALLALLPLLLFTACQGQPAAPGKTAIKVGATAVPHAKILEAIRPELADKGIDLQIVDFTDYVTPNTALSDKQLDANFFQHINYLNWFDAEYGVKLVSIANVHYEPMGIYAGKASSIADLPDGAQIAVPNDTTNEGRALWLLEAQGLIKLKEGATLSATAIDIAENPKNLKIVELEAAQVPRSIQDVDLAVVNGNYAIEAGLAIADALAIEAQDSNTAKEYTNVLAVREGDEKRPELVALAEALRGETARKFIEETYKGSVVPVD